MRISDWSSDVCSSDLGRAAMRRRRRHKDYRLADAKRAPAMHCEYVLNGKERAGLGLDLGHDRFGKAGIRIERQAGHSRSEEHTSELQSLMRISYAVSCLKKKNKNQTKKNNTKN